jgi:AcrR family transcriptional regulator
MTEAVRTSSATPQRILDAAEDLFAAHGIQATSLRSITQRAGVNTAAIHYHFGDKVALVRAIVARRVAPVNRERLERLEVLERIGRPTPEQLLEAYLVPVISARRSWGQDTRKLGALMARLRLEGARFETRGAGFREIQERYARSLSAALPGLGVELAGERLEYAVGAMMHLLMNSAAHAENQVGGGLEARFESMIVFLSAGFRAPPEPRLVRSQTSAAPEVRPPFAGATGARS